ncbi:hypothetical protein VUR80DRAFT_4249 [Thermomyces stellatus]
MGDAGKRSPPAKSPSPGALGSSPHAASSPIDDSAPLAVDENPEEDDLGISVSDQSDTTSLKSSILRYREENGRTYHSYKDGAYLAPNDSAENERLDLQHTICLLTFGHRLHCAPLTKEAPRVLDAGCGTGVWSIEFADENPDAQVTGVDLSPIQPAFIPPNVTFVVDDVEDDWTFSAPFDFIYSRFLTGSIKNWPRFFRQSFENLNPGGYIELLDSIYPVISDDGTLPPDSALRRWSEITNNAFRDSGRSLDTALNYEQQLAEAGFVNICVIREKWPTNRWPRDKKYKQLGIWALENCLSGLSSWTLAIFTRPKSENGLGWSREEVEVFLADVRRDLKDTNIHAYIPVWTVYAQKPE